MFVHVLDVYILVNILTCVSRNYLFLPPLKELFLKTHLTPLEVPIKIYKFLKIFCSIDPTLWKFHSLLWKEYECFLEQHNDQKESSPRSQNSIYRPVAEQYWLTFLAGEMLPDEFLIQCTCSLFPKSTI